MERKQTRHAVYQITCHLIWCPKYRRPIPEGAVTDRVVELLNNLVPALDGELVVRPDHVHLSAHFPPTIAVYQIMHRLKGVTSDAVRAEFPALRNRLPSLWTAS